MAVYAIKKIGTNISALYSADLRALSLMRIGLAIVILADLLIRGSDLAAHYTNEGLWPLHLIHTFGWKAGNWSLHAMSGSYGWELSLFILHFGLAIGLLLGYHTRIVTLLVWLLTISLHNRNLYVQQAGDDLLRLLLFWGLFLPWHAHYSLDAKRKSRSRKQTPFANVGYFILIASVYFFTVNLKSSPEWRSEHSAIYYALSLEQLRLPFGDWLYQFPGFMNLLTQLVFYTECLLPLLILLPSKKGTLRFIAFILILLLHAGIGLSLYVGLFFVINIVSAIGLLPSFVMDRVETRFLKRRSNEMLKHASHNESGIKTSSASIITNTLAAAAIVICLIINLSAMPWFSYQLKKEVLYPVNIFRFDQYWGMFSPYILKKDGWLVYYGIDEQGRQWDLRTNSDYVDFKKPEHIVSMYKSDRWRKLAENMQNGSFTFLRPLYSNYILKQWNVKHPEKKIVTLNLYFMEKESLPDYNTTPVVKTLYCVSTL